MKPVAKVMRRVLYQVFESRYPPYFIEIILKWHRIAAPFAHLCCPIKILSYKEKSMTKNKLYICSTDSSLSLQLHFHKSVMMERIALLVGYNVHDISVTLNLSQIE